jgi:hypothetical protein
MTTIRSQCADILTAIRNDAAISACIATNWPGTTLNLFLGLDSKELPPETSLPWIAAIPRAFGRHDDYVHRENEIALAVAIKTAGTTGSSTTAFQELSGMEPLEELIELIQTRAAIALDQNLMGLSDVQIDIDIPYYRASWSFRVPTEI